MSSFIRFPHLCLLLFKFKYNQLFLFTTSNSKFYLLTLLPSLPSLVVFDTCEDFIAAARRIATSQSLSLTISHKSRNTPGKEAVQHRGCLVLNCLRFDDRENSCKLSIKAFGPIDGGWKMRPILQGSPNKQIVASSIQCNHGESYFLTRHLNNLVSNSLIVFST